MADKIYDKWLNRLKSKNIPINIVPSKDISRETYGAYIETMPEGQLESTFGEGKTIKRPNNIDPNSTAIIYNPDEADDQDVKLDLLHIYRQKDPDYQKLINGFSEAFKKSNYYGDFERAFTDNAEGYDPNTRNKDNEYNNFVDGIVRNLFFEGDFKKHNYWEDAGKEYFSDPNLKKSFEDISTYLEGEPMKYKEGGSLGEDLIGIEIGEKSYKVKCAKTQEEKFKGLQNIKHLPEDEGMLFFFDKPENVGFYMKDTYIPLDIIFIDEDCEVISIVHGVPESEKILSEKNVKYVLELNSNSGIEEGDELNIDEEDDSSEEIPAMKVIAPDGSTQMELEGGERIVSRKETRILIKKAKKAEGLKHDSAKYEKACKSLGRYMFKVLNGQDNRKPEYVEQK